MRLLRKALGLLSLAALAAGAVIVARRRFVRNRERVDVYYEDGSMASYEEGSADAERLLPLAREALNAARSA